MTTFWGRRCRSACPKAMEITSTIVVSAHKSNQLLSENYGANGARKTHPMDRNGQNFAGQDLDVKDVQ